jgi:hypothetical protein
MGKQHLTAPVWYLEESDFNNTTLSADLSKKPAIIFVQSLRCGFCTEALPAFQEFANKFGGKSGKINCFTIRCNVGSGDSPKLQQGEQALCEKVKKLIPDFRGYPTIAGFVNGKYAGSSNFTRDVDGFKQFAESLSR